MVSLALSENGIIINAFRFIAWNELAGSHWSFERGYLCWARESTTSAACNCRPNCATKPIASCREHIPNARPAREETPSRPSTA